MKNFLSLLIKLKYPALALSTTGAGFGICSLLHNFENKEMQEKNKKIKELQGKYQGSEKKKRDQLQEFIANALKAPEVQTYQLSQAYSAAKSYATCVRDAFKENEDKNSAWFGKDYLTQERLNSRCKEPTENS